MRTLAQDVQARGQELLGALMFSCNARGPRDFLDFHGEGTTDHQAFRLAFPNAAVSVAG